MFYYRAMQRRDQRAANANYYRRNRDREIARVRGRQDATRDALRALRQRPCHDCGGTFKPHQMDFDHRESVAKAFRLTSGRGMLSAQEDLTAELAKCDVVCANCHRIRTRARAEGQPHAIDARPPSRDLARKRAYWQGQARLLDDLKSRACVDCARTFPACAMDFDHVQPGQKRYTVSRMIGRAGTAAIMAEVAKCDIVCANCHRDRTFRRREAGSSERE